MSTEPLPRPENRRRFIARCGLAAAGLMLAAPSLEAADPLPRKRPLKKGYMLNTFPGKASLSLMEQFKMLKAAGFEGVEPRSHLDRDEVLKARDATGLAIGSVSCGQHSRLMSQAAPSQRQNGIDGVKQALRDAKAYGAPAILLVPGVVDERTAYDEAYERMHNGIRELVPLAEELGVKIAIENVWNHFLLSPLEAARFVDEFKSPAVGWHFDIGNIINMGWPEQWIRILNQRIVTLHIKEYSRKKRDTEGPAKGFQVEYLEGDNNWPVIMKALDEIKYAGWAIAEPAYRPTGIEPAERLRQISTRMDKIFAL
jgi:L-ribulose-5-phosphate 3-epimerase